MARIAILFVVEDAQWRDAAVAALADFAHALTPLRARSVIDPGVPVVLIWTAHAARRHAEARAILRGCADIIVWRPDGAHAPAWLADATPIGPEMPVRTLALMAKHVLAEQGRRDGVTAPQRRGPGQLALAVCIGVSVIGAAAGAAMLYATRDPARAAMIADKPPIAGLRGPL